MNTHCVAWLGLESRLEVVTTQGKHARYAIYGMQGQYSAFAVANNCTLFATMRLCLLAVTDPGTWLDSNASMLPTTYLPLVLVVLCRSQLATIVYGPPAAAAGSVSHTMSFF